VLVDADGVVVRLDGDRLTELVHVPGARAAALHEERLAVASTAGVRLSEGSDVRNLDVHDAVVTDLAWSGRGHRLAASTAEGGLFVWNRAGELLGALPGHVERAAALEFLPDGDLVSVSWDHTARFWALAELDRPVAELARDVDAAWGPEDPP
jgi:WD40 repeat protein